MSVSRTISERMSKNLQKLYYFCSHQYSSSLQSMVLTEFQWPGRLAGLPEQVRVQHQL